LPSPTSQPTGWGHNDSPILPQLNRHWLALLGPAGIPADIAERLSREINATLSLPDVREKLAGIGLGVVAGGAAQFTPVLQRDVVKWTDAVKRSGAVAE
jgi:tripartite-type tricarboxylate transporter receptor subunit TctC